MRKGKGRAIESETFLRNDEFSNTELSELNTLLQQTVEEVGDQALSVDKIKARGHQICSN